MPEGAGENPHEITGLSMTEIQALLNKSSQDALFRYPLKCPIDQDHIIDIAHMKRHIADCRRRNAHLGQVKCLYNEYHYTNIGESRGHADSCPDRKNTVQDFRDPEQEKITAAVQMVKLKVECGLPLTAEEESLRPRHSPE